MTWARRRSDRSAVLVTAAGAMAPLLVVSGCSGVDQADPTVIAAVCLSHEPGCCFGHATARTSGSSRFTLTMVTRIGEWDQDSTASLLVQVDGQWARPVAHGTNQVLFADIHPNDDVIAVSLDTVITVIDFEGTTIDTVSSSAWVSTSPSWSPSGKQLVWVSEGVGPPYPGTAVLFTTNYPANSDLTPIIGNDGQPFDRLPVFPDW